MTTFRNRRALAGAVALSLACVAGAQVVRSAAEVVREGDPVAGMPGWSIAGINTPFTNTDGTVGFTGSIVGETTINYVWYDTGIVWLNTDAAPAFILSGAEDTSGVGANGAFLYSTAATPAGGTSEDAVWSHLGLVARGTEQIPGLEDRFYVACSRTTMFGANFGAFVSTTSTTAGGSTTGRALMRWNPTDGATVVFKTGDVVFPAPDDFAIAFASPTIAFAYDFSDNGLHHVHLIGLVTGSTANDAYIYKDGMPLLREGSLVPGTTIDERWQNFSGMSINNDGTSLVFGDTSGPAAADAFLAVNGDITLREGESTVGGVLLDFGSSCLGASINNLGRVVHVWNVASSTNRTVFAGDVTNLAAGCAIVAHGDQLDITGDGAGDRVVTNIQVSQTTSPGLDLAEDGVVYIRMETTDLLGTDEQTGIYRFSTSCPAACDPDFNQDGNVDQDDIACLAQVVAGDPACSPVDPDFNRDGNVDQDDIAALEQVVAGAECP
ncbi:MAG: hypothetical protein SFY69_09060 [Planctomycetota bacterium]|nr:hypothetical protein [Planctomycetota bacterium]